MKIINLRVPVLDVHVNKFSGAPDLRILRTHTEDVEVPHDPETHEVTMHVFEAKLVLMVNPKPRSHKPKEVPRDRTS